MYKALRDKSAESYEVSKYCLNNKKYNSGISRIYYSMFQIIKATCELKAFDVDKFERKGRRYPHSELNRIFTDLISCRVHKFDLLELKGISLRIDAIRTKRENSDYNNDIYNESDLIEAIEIADKVNRLISQIP